MMQNPSMSCPECSKKIGEGSDESVYSHAVHCMNLPGRGPDMDLGLVSKRDDEYGRRAKTLLKAVIG